MSHRGRGLLEVKPSNNPFFQTTSADVGIRPHENIEWKVEGKTPIFHFSNHNVDGNFSFLYTRESDKIGSQVRQPESKEIKVLTKTEFLKKKVEQAMSVTNSSTGYSDTIIKPSSPFKRSAEDILKVYKHAPKVEDPRYTTSMNEYGIKAPSVATIVTERAARPQGFSKSFQNMKNENTGLNTAITRSTVHKSLDPQFA